MPSIDRSWVRRR